MTTPLTSPYGVSLTSAIASSSVSNGITGATGAKISSRHSSESSGTSTTTVGRKNSPSALPPSTTVAPRLDRGVEHLPRAVALGLVDHRAEADAVVGRVADGDRGGARGERARRSGRRASGATMCRPAVMQVWPW